VMEESSHRDFNIGQQVHLGMGTNGGAGYIGTLQKIEGDGTVHVQLPGEGKYGPRVVKGHVSKLSMAEAKEKEQVLYQVFPRIPRKQTNEEAEQIDEISDTTRRSWIGKTFPKHFTHWTPDGIREPSEGPMSAARKKVYDKAVKKSDKIAMKNYDDEKRQKREAREPQVHDLRHLSHGEAYDETQTNSKIKDGDVLRVKGGTAVMLRAWPTMVHGKSDTLHSFKNGVSIHDVEGGSYHKTGKLADKVHGLKEEASHIAERLTGKSLFGKLTKKDFGAVRSKMMKESVQTLMEDTTPALSASMKAILADAFHMYFKAHSYHWNVEGSNFPQYHKFFGDIYEQLFDTIDPIAEEIRALGDYAPRSLDELKGSTSISTESAETPAAMLSSLLGDNNKIIAGLMNGYKVAEAAGEVGLSNFLQDKIDAHKKLGWMIKSTSKGA